jgi:lipopolysaccharide biosynthesis glycosyltransferase
MTNQKTSLVYTIDDNYIPHFATSLTSLLRTNPNLFDRYFLIMSQPDMTQLKKTIKFFKKEFDIKLEILNFDVLQFEPSELSELLPKSTSTYFRMFLAELLPKEVEKVIYLDADTVVIGKLEELINQKFNNCYFLAVPECLFSSNSVPEKLIQGNLLGRHYFNTGVMFVDVSKWRSDKASNQLLNTGKQNKNQITLWDQDILNICFKNQIGEMDGRFNSFILHKKMNPDPIIIHYAGPVKPWQIFNSHPYRAEYKYYRNQTPFVFKRTLQVTLRPAILQFLHRSTLGSKIIQVIKFFWNSGQ